MKIILDIRGLLLHSYHSGTDPEATLTEAGTKIPTPAHMLQNFLTLYLRDILRRVKPWDIIAVMDGGNSYRQGIYPQYKRPEKPSELEPAVKEARDKAIRHGLNILVRLGIPVAHVPGLEADDVIAYLCANLKGNKVVYTVDQDLIQLANPSCKVIIRGEDMQDMRIEDIGKVRPSLIRLYKSLVGDSSDNYPGIKGIGKKTFFRLHERYGIDGLEQLDEAIKTHKFDILNAAIAETADKDLSKLMECRNDWYMCYRLAGLAPELVGSFRDGKYALVQWTKRVPTVEKMRKALEECNAVYLLLEFEPYLVKFNLVTAAGNTVESLVAEAKKLFAVSPCVAIDWETSDKVKNENFRIASKDKKFVDVYSSELTGAGFTFGPNLEYSIYVSLDHANTENLPIGIIQQLIESIPANVPKVAHNSNFEDTIYTKTFGAHMTNVIDTAVLASYVDENESHGLKDLSLRFLGYKQLRYEDVIEENKNMCDYSAEHVFRYGADDPLVTAHLYLLFSLMLELDGQKDFVLNEACPPIQQYVDNFLAGVEVDWEELKRQGQEDRETYAKAVADLRDILKANQTEQMITEGATRVLEEEWPLVEAKLLAKNPDVDLAEEQDRLLKTIRDKVRYQDYVEVTEEVSFVPTETQLSAIMQKHGLPAVERISRKYIANYVAQYGSQAPEIMKPFFELLYPASEFFKSRQGEVYDEFVKLAKALGPTKTVMVGTQLNLQSPVQMKRLLYGTLNLPVRIRNFDLTDTQEELNLDTPNAQANYDAWITALAEDTVEGSWQREAINLLLKAISCQTRLKMFYNVYPLWCYPDGLIRPQINSCGTTSRRPSSKSPNCLQWPKRGEGKKFRKCIKPLANRGHDLIFSIDWSQQELRVGGALAMDKAFLDCYVGKDVEHVISQTVKDALGDWYPEFIKTSTRDVHTMTAAASPEWQVSYEEMEAALKSDDKELAAKADKARQQAKPTNFLGSYGGGPTKLARKLIVPVEEAKRILETKKELYHGFETWREDMIRYAHEHGFVKNVFGSIRHAYTGLTHYDSGFVKSVERSLINYLIQGCCADNLKRVLRICVDRELFKKHDAVMYAPIYDEIAGSVSREHASGLILELHSIMTQDIPGLPVPMLAEPSIGLNFADQIEIGPFPTHEKIQEAIEKCFA